MYPRLPNCFRLYSEALSVLKRAVKPAAIVLCAFVVNLYGAPQVGAVNSAEASNEICSTTTRAAYKAGKNEIRDDFWITYGNCINLADTNTHEECLDVAREELKEASELVKEQFSARLEVCAALGEEPYDPSIHPEDFVDFEAVIAGDDNFTPNQYFPLIPGLTLIYVVKDGEGDRIERIKVEVLPEIKEILGVNCIVVRDRVWEFDDEGGRSLIEDTFDWYGQDLFGNVWYMGEIARNYEDGELVDLEGSWKAGREYDKPGFIMVANPQEGDIYRQEFSLGNAEDIGEVVGYLERVMVNKITYENVLKTMDYTPVEPEVVEFKYYAPGVGVILEENPIDGERLELKSVIFPE